MKTDHLMEFTNGEILDIYTGKPATKEEAKAFKKKVVKNKKETMAKIAKRKKSSNDFINKHRTFLKRFIFTEDEQLNEYDYDDCVYLLSTALFDCSDNIINKTKLLKEIKSEFGKKFCVDVLGGFENGQHDT